MEDVFGILRNGGWVDRADPETDTALLNAASRSLELRRRYNYTAPAEERSAIMAEILGYPLPEGAVIVPPFHCDLGNNINIGAGAVINADCVLLDYAEISIGEGALIGPQTRLVTPIHPIDPDERRLHPLRVSAKPIRIGDYAWLGAGATVLPGITVGDYAVVGAGAVVTHDVEPRTVVAGNPARVIRRLRGNMSGYKFDDKLHKN